MKWLIIGCIFIFVSFCLHLLNINFNLKIFSDLYTNSLVAFVFYYFFQYYPKKKNDKNSIKVLNQITYSIYEAFITQNPFSHEKPTKRVNISVTSEEISNLIEKVKNWDFKDSFKAISSLESALATADSKLREFENLLILANNISPAHSLEWLNLTHELRLFANEYKNYKQFSSSNDSVSLEALKTKEYRNLNEREQYLDTLQIRFIMFLEVTIEWKDFCRNFKH
ncbi:MAG: hypothetical protein EBY20_06310 [Alphaproteobacteria bacterium]|nr:hypothetical protein [Alphaproteobacteria bacterium]NDE19817.1 hypothetical protein [Alphaproteobacteria bacterium]